jgi:hypothetical protein
MIIFFPLSGCPSTNKGRHVLGWYCGGMAGYVDALEEAGLLREFVGVLDSINSALAVVERHGPPPVIARTLIYDELSMLDNFAREYRGHVGKVMDNVCMELRSLIYEVLGGE